MRGLRKNAREASFFAPRRAILGTNGTVDYSNTIEAPIADNTRSKRRTGHENRSSGSARAGGKSSTVSNNEKKYEDRHVVNLSASHHRHRFIIFKRVKKFMFFFHGLSLTNCFEKRLWLNGLSRAWKFYAYWLVSNFWSWYVLAGQTVDMFVSLMLKKCVLMSFDGEKMVVQKTNEFYVLL